MSIMSKLTAAYIAGLIDGEGSLEFQKTKKNTYKNGIMYQARIRVCMTDKSLVEWLYKSFGGYFSTREFENENWNTSYEWTLKNTKNIEPFICKIVPYLKVKKGHAIVIIEFLKTFNKSSYNIVKHKFGYGIGYHKEINDEIMDLRKELYYKIKKLNKRGKFVQPERLSKVSS